MQLRVIVWGLIAGCGLLGPVASLAATVSDLVTFGANTFSARNAVEAHENRIKFVVHSARNEALWTVHNVAVAIPNRRSFNMREIRAMQRFGERDATTEAAGHDLAQILFAKPLVLG